VIDALFPEQINYLTTIPDTNMPSLTLYQATITLPEIPIAHAYFGVTYYGAEVSATFFQCSDVMIL
jgi:hypothetical protein